jgi:sugar phosphate isomerase/epimerase
MRRRRFLLASLTAALPAKTYRAPASSRPNRIGRDRLSAITDEIGRSPEASIAFLKQYDLRWAELRAIPGGKAEYAFLPADAVRQAASAFSEAGIRISFLNSSLLKFAWPGTEPVRRREESAQARARRLESEQTRWQNRHRDLETACRNAHLLGVDKLRVFTGFRVADPPKLFPRIVDTLGAMSKIAAREKIHLLIENENSCNVATSSEMAAVLKDLPSRWIGVNWDPLNEAAQNQPPFPDGYQKLPHRRLLNVQIKGRSVLPGPQRLDWAAIFAALEAGGYRGKIGLETHIFGDGQIQASHDSMREILRLVEPS